MVEGKVNKEKDIRNDLEGTDEEMEDNDIEQVEQQEQEEQKEENAKEEKDSVAAIAAKAQENVFSPELLKMYYKRLFPYSFLYNWLSYDPNATLASSSTTVSKEDGKKVVNKRSDIFSRREFSFTIELAPGDEIFARYHSFSSEGELKAAVMKRQPRKIDIGAVFNHPPKDKNAYTHDFRPCQRELVFDIDLTDYDETRNCGCSGASICHKCWEFMTMAVKVMDLGLRDDFGFDHIAWFYSGRRGVHAWVCDESARLLSNDARAAVATYFEVELSKKNNECMDNPTHPMLTRAFEILEPMFIESVLPDSGHGLLDDKEHWEALLKTLPDAAEEVANNLINKWSGKDGAATSPERKWKHIKLHLEKFVKIKTEKSGSKKTKQLSYEEVEAIKNWPKEVVFRYTYPKLDINVSKMQNHLLKSPFCVHPKTGRVCVPIQVQTVDSFDPFQVPTLPQLMEELDQYDHANSDSAPQPQDWHKTSLKSYFEPFQNDFLEPLMAAWRENMMDEDKDEQPLQTKEMTARQLARDEKERQAALVGDF